MFEKGGNVVDAAIATSLCNGIINSHSMGIGGGFFMTIYIKKEKKAYVINARESAPESSFKDMFANNKFSEMGGLAT